MSRKKNLPPPSSSSKSEKAEPPRSLRSFRELIESLAIALVLAFIFKAFAAEAYVIPTGSMATTLMGQHKDIECSRCGFPFQINASKESNPGAERQTVLAGTCPQCRFTMYVGPDNPENKTHLTYNGDRIFVNKCCFNFRKPTRWNVTVFRYPGKPQVNYIKRLVGVENETLRIRHGDIFVKKDGESEFTIQRKPFKALLAMLRPVDDNDYVQPELHKIGWPTRWFFDEESAWTGSEGMKTFRSPKTDNGTTTWLTYRNIIPSSEDWFHLSQNKMPPYGAVKNPQLITDFVGYNSEVGNGGFFRDSIIQREIGGQTDFFCSKAPESMGLNWVGDLAVSCSLQVEGISGNVCLRLIKGGVAFLCDINVDDGKATLSIPGFDGFSPAMAETPIRSGKTFNILFCNIDEEMRLAVDGKEINFGGAGCYDKWADDLTSPLARNRPPTELDLTPVAIGVRGTDAEIRHVKVLRDIYYIAGVVGDHTSNSICDLENSPFHPYSEDRINRVLSQSQYWEHFGKTRTREFKLEKGQYLMFGDNSACSNDSRLWTTDGIPASVDRDFLIGEAVFVYWPHGFRIPGTRIALIPNFAKMRLIH